MTAFHTQDARCPNCNVEAQSLFSANAERGPKAGDLGFCPKCHESFEFDEALQLRKVDLEKLSPQDRNTLAAHRAFAQEPDGLAKLAAAALSQAIIDHAFRCGASAPTIALALKLAMESMYSAVRTKLKGTELERFERLAAGLQESTDRLNVTTAAVNAGAFRQPGGDA